MMLSSSPPVSPWRPSDDVLNTIVRWLEIALYVGLACSILTVIIFGAMLVLDRDRGQPVSATSPAVRVFQIALGVLVMTSAGSIAKVFF